MKVQVKRSYKLFFCHTHKKNALHDISFRINLKNTPSYTSMDSLRSLSLSKIFVEFLSNLYISPSFGKIFQFMVLRLLEKVFATQTIESINFFSCPQAKLLPFSYDQPPGRRKLPIYRRQNFLKTYFHQAERGEGKETIELTK